MHIAVGIVACWIGFWANLAAQSRIFCVNIETILVSFQLGLEVSFPVPAGIATNVQIVGLQFFSVLFIATMTLLQHSFTNMHIATWIGTSFVCIATIFTLLFKGNDLILGQIYQ